MQVAGQTADMQRLIVEQSNVVGATCLYSGGNRMPEATFDWAIVDEAGRATVPEALVPIAKSERVILVGDERQLPPMVDADIAGEESDIALDDSPLDMSLFQTLVEQAEQEGHWHLASLRRQYRMHPAIGNLISEAFYDGKLEQGLSASDFQGLQLAEPAGILAVHLRFARQGGKLRGDGLSRTVPKQTGLFNGCRTSRTSAGNAIYARR